MKRIMKSTATAVIIIAMIAGGAVNASAANNTSATTQGGLVDASAANIGIEPFTSPIVQSVVYSITRTSSSVTVTLTGIRSGRITAVVQRWNGSSWVDHAVIADDTFPMSVQVFRTRAIALSSGWYRIRLTVVASGHTFNDASSYVQIP
jgi:type V secretory pathway adhesin AidA